MRRVPMTDYDSLFYLVDAFSKAFVQWWQKSLLKYSEQWKKRNRFTLFLMTREKFSI
jgi:hypothetical protein